ncbi:protein kinase domain-containing protein [Ditylenchus destructor]|nr:protein kinase domain-containing protein [Ditylenchus destructor]
MSNTNNKDLPTGNTDVSVYEPDNTYLFMVMDYYQGGDLKSLQDAIVSTRKKEGIQNVFSFTEAQVRFYVAQMILALECLQEKNIAHRDIKPQNILIDKQGYIKLADFGLAKDESEFNVSTRVSGTYAYMAPELAKIKLSKKDDPLTPINPQTYTKAVDLWSLGATAFELLFVQMPFRGKDRKELLLKKIEGKLVIPSKIANQQVSNEFKDLLRGLMNPEPDNRLGNRRNFKKTFDKKKPNEKTKKQTNEKKKQNEETKKQPKEKKKPGLISKIASLFHAEESYGMIELKNHQWFKIKIGDSPPIDWEQLKNKKLPFVPYVPTNGKDRFSFRDNHGKGFGLKHTKPKEKPPPNEVIRSHMSPNGD